MNIANYLDDFAVVEETEEECRKGQAILRGMLRQLGFSVAWDKLVGPSREVDFLGIAINTEKMNSSLLLGKIACLLETISKLESKG